MPFVLIPYHHGHHNGHRFVDGGPPPSTMWVFGALHKREPYPTISSRGSSWRARAVFGGVGKVSVVLHVRVVGKFLPFGGPEGVWCIMGRNDVDWVIEPQSPYF